MYRARKIHPTGADTFLDIFKCLVERLNLCRIRSKINTSVYLSTFLNTDFLNMSLVVHGKNKAIAIFHGTYTNWTFTYTNDERPYNLHTS